MPADAQSQVSPSREARLFVLCGLVVLYSGLFSAVFSDNRLGTFLGIGAAVAGALMVIPQLIVGAIQRTSTR